MEISSLLLHFVVVVKNSRTTQNSTLDMPVAPPALSLVRTAQPLGRDGPGLGSSPKTLFHNLLHLIDISLHP